MPNDSDRTPVTSSSVTPSSRIESFTIVLHIRMAYSGGRPQARCRRLYRTCKRFSSTLFRFVDAFDIAPHGGWTFYPHSSAFVRFVAKKFDRWRCPPRRYGCCAIDAAAEPADLFPCIRSPSPHFSEGAGRSCPHSSCRWTWTRSRRHVHVRGFFDYNSP